MSVLLIRHAHAGNRSSWRGEDAERPLSERGHLQAQGLIALLADRTITSVASSPALRCDQTVEPLAASLGLTVTLDKRLAEGSPLRPALGLVLAADDAVLCAHGDLIPDIMSRLVSQGMKATRPERCQKGSVWEIEIDHARAIRARYLPPVQLG
jgi:broad specificity phosphatase PhoE